MKKENKVLNHGIWFQCNCGCEFDLRTTDICPNCKTHYSENYGI